MAINPDMRDLTKLIDTLLREYRPDRYTVNGGEDDDDDSVGAEWLDDIAEKIADKIPDAEVRKVLARTLVGKREGIATRKANDFIRKLRGQMVLDWWDFVDEPISVVTRVDEPGKPQRLIEERVALRASSAEDFLAFAREERRRAANDFTARNQTCEAAEWIASRLIETGHRFFPGWAASEFPEQPA